MYELSLFRRTQCATNLFFSKLNYIMQKRIISESFLR